MNSLVGESHTAKAITSELAIAREMGSIFNYLPEEIDEYMHNLNSTFTNGCDVTPA